MPIQLQTYVIQWCLMETLTVRLSYYVSEQHRRNYVREYIEGKVHPVSDHEGPEGKYRYSYTLSLTSALDGNGWSTPRSGRFTPGKQTRYQPHRRMGEPQGWRGRMQIISHPLGLDSRTVHPRASSCIDYVREYSDTSANEDNSFRNHIRQPKSSLAET